MTVPWPFAGFKALLLGSVGGPAAAAVRVGCPRSCPGYTNSFMGGVGLEIRPLLSQFPQGAMPKKAILAQSHTVILPKQATGFKSQYPKRVSKMTQLA